MKQEIMNSSFIVRWQDDRGEDRNKTYDDYATAQKAYKWLMNNGVEIVDIAILKKVIEPTAE